jgi:hypothetical protein
MKTKMTKLHVDGDGVDFVVDCADADAAEVENVLAVVIDNGIMNEDLDGKMNVNSNLKIDVRGRYANTPVQVHVFVSDMQMND